MVRVQQTNIGRAFGPESSYDPCQQAQRAASTVEIRVRRDPFVKNPDQRRMEWVRTGDLTGPPGPDNTLGQIQACGERRTARCGVLLADWLGRRAGSGFEETPSEDPREVCLFAGRKHEFLAGD